MTSVLAPIYASRDANVFTSRLSSTSLLCIDSNDRFKNNAIARDVNNRINSTAYDFSITKNESIMNGFFTRLGVSEVMFQWMIPNINVQTSIVGFDYKIGSAPFVSDSIVLVPGFYTPAMIASAIQAEVRLLDPSLNAFTMTYGVNIDGQQAPVFAYNTNSLSVYVRFYPLDSFDLGTIPQININSRQLFDLLGFTTTTPIIPDPSGNDFSISGQGYTTYCQITRYIDIVCSQLTNSQSLKDTMSQVVARDVLCRVYLSDSANSQSTVLPSSATFCPAGCMPTTLYKNFSQPKQIQWIPNQPVPGSLRFEVFDEDGNNLNLLSNSDEEDGANWAITMLVTEN
jgi:hypothetical protein